MSDIVQRRCNTDLDMCLGGELRAEIERLRGIIAEERPRHMKVADLMIRDLKDEIEQLRADNVRLRALIGDPTASTPANAHWRAKAETAIRLQEMYRDQNERLRKAIAAGRERCALMAYREIIGAVDDVSLANTIRDAIRKGEPGND